MRDYLKFQLPYGVVLSGNKGDFEPELISEGFTKYTDDNGTEHLDVVVDRTRLLDTYFKILENLKSIRVFWIKVAKDWENSEVAEFYANKEFNNLYKIKKIISDNLNDIFLNGHVSIAVYSSDSATNICIDEHKKIQISTESNEFIKMSSKYIQNIGFKYYEYDEFHSVDHGYYHWHYRPSNSDNRSDLIKYLKDNSFFLWRTE